MRLTYVPKDKLDEYWPQVREALERVVRKGASDWKVEHVYVMLFNGTAYLMVDDKGGAMVWMRYTREDGAGMMFILAAGGDLGARGPYYEEVMRLAKEAGCKVIRMISPRKGWQRDPFWKMTGYVYEHEVK